MGYSYGMTASGRWARDCDHCGKSGGTKIYECIYKVYDAGDRSNGQRFGLPYCMAPSLCRGCFNELGGIHGVHGERCREGAAESQRRDDEVRARLERGDRIVHCAWGDWHDDVPEGYVGIVGWSLTAGESYHLVPTDQYQNRSGDNFVENYEIHPWLGPSEHRTTKEVQLIS